MQRSTVSCKTEKITCEMHGKWTLIHSKHIKIENMPPQLVVGFCRCWLSKRTALKNAAPSVLANAAAAPRARLRPSPGEQLRVWPHVVLWSSTWPSRDDGCSAHPGDKSPGLCLLPEGTCHPHWRPDSVRHQCSSTSQLRWQDGELPAHPVEGPIPGMLGTGSHVALLQVWPAKSWMPML